MFFEVFILHWWDLSCNEFFYNNFCINEGLKRKQRSLPSKKRRKKHKGKVLITSDRFNWRLIFKMKNDITLPLFDTDTWWQKQLRLIRKLNIPSFLFVCFFCFYLFIYLFFFVIFCSVSNEEARHEVESETSQRKRGRPSNNAKKRERIEQRRDIQINWSLGKLWVIL